VDRLPCRRYHGPRELDALHPNASDSILRVRGTWVITAVRNRTAVTGKRHSGTAPGNARGSGSHPAPRKPLAGQGNLGICRQGDLLHRPSSCPITRRWGRGHQRTALSAVQASLIAFPSPVCPELGIIRKRNHTNGARRCERAKGNRSARPAKHVRCQRKPHPARRARVVHCRTVGGDLCHTTSAPTAAPRLPATIPTIPSATAVSTTVRLPRIRNALKVAGVNTQ